VSVVISHESATSCIRVPTFDATDAIYNARNTGNRNGDQALAVSEGWFAASMKLFDHPKFIRPAGNCSGR
jgi:hypothetical protein